MPPIAQVLHSAMAWEKAQGQERKGKKKVVFHNDLSDSLQPNSDGLQPNSDGLQP